MAHRSRKSFNILENENRIYRDGETERFLSDVVSLLTHGSSDCETLSKPDVDDSTILFNEDACQKPKLDLVVLFDNTDNTSDFSNPRIIQDRYLLLDVLGIRKFLWIYFLGSLSTGEDVKVAIYSFADHIKLEHRFLDSQDRESLFEKIESIMPKHDTPSYANAIHQGLSYYNQNKRPNARGIVRLRLSYII